MNRDRRCVAHLQLHDHLSLYGLRQGGAARIGRHGRWADGKQPAHARHLLACDVRKGLGQFHLCAAGGIGKAKVVDLGWYQRQQQGHGFGLIFGQASEAGAVVKAKLYPALCAAMGDDGQACLGQGVDIPQDGAVRHFQRAGQ